MNSGSNKFGRNKAKKSKEKSKRGRSIAYTNYKHFSHSLCNVS